MKDYKINESTLAIIPLDKTKTKVYENDNIIIVEKNSKKIMEDNCLYFGSTYEGRKKGTEILIGVTHKPPLVISENNNLIFFPTSSPRNKECAWISFDNISDFLNEIDDKKSEIIFKNNMKLELPISKNIVNTQIIRSMRLESAFNKNKE